jgi:hypothetical protein
LLFAAPPPAEGIVVTLPIGAEPASLVFGAALASAAISGAMVSAEGEVELLEVLLGTLALVGFGVVLLGVVLFPGAFVEVPVEAFEPRVLLPGTFVELPVETLEPRLAFPVVLIATGFVLKGASVVEETAVEGGKLVSVIGGT